MSKKHKSTNLHEAWAIHTPCFLREVLSNTDALSIPMNIFGKILGDVADRAAELNDDRLNQLMMQLTLYSCADPESPDYDKELTEEYRQKRVNYKKD